MSAEHGGSSGWIGRPRARDLGVPLRGEPGEWNAITDVAGVEVGYETLIDGDGPLVVGRGPVRTGVTAVLPLGRSGVGRSCPAGWYSLNGNGEMTGVAWLDESGALSLPGRHHQHARDRPRAQRDHRLVAGRCSRRWRPAGTCRLWPRRGTAT